MVDSLKSLTITQKNTLIKKIPDLTYTDKQILKIVGYIKNGDITTVSDFPEPTKGGIKISLDFKNKSEVIAKKKVGRPAIDKPDKVLRKRGRPAKKSEGQKIEERKVVIQKMADKKKEKRKPYFKANEPPEGFKEASMKEAADEHKILLWGKKKADPVLIQSQFKTKINTGAMMIKIASLRGKMGKIKKDLLIAKTDVVKNKLIDEHNILLIELKKKVSDYEKAKAKNEQK